MRGIFVDCTSELQAIMERQRLVVPAVIDVNCGSPSADELIALCFGYDVILVEHTVVPPQVFDVCPTVRAVVFMGTGAGTYVDLADAERRGIAVLTTPGYGDRAVAEHAFALMFSAARDVARMDRQIRAGIWSPTGGLQLKGRTIAVIGLGGIGMEFASMARSVGMNVRAWSRTSRDVEGYVGSIDDALKDADVVSLHLALNADTSGLLDRRRLHLPRPGFVLVNTARAGLVDERSMLDALADRQIGHAALDVFPDEPLPADSVYRTLGVVTLTAHAAYMTEDAYAELWHRAVAAFESVG